MEVGQRVSPQAERESCNVYSNTGENDDSITVAVRMKETDSRVFQKRKLQCKGLVLERTPGLQN